VSVEGLQKAVAGAADFREAPDDHSDAPPLVEGAPEDGVGPLAQGVANVRQERRPRGSRGRALVPPPLWRLGPDPRFIGVGLLREEVAELGDVVEQRHPGDRRPPREGGPGVEILGPKVQGSILLPQTPPEFLLATLVLGDDLLQLAEVRRIESRVKPTHLLPKI